MNNLNKKIYYIVIFIFTVFVYDGFVNSYIILRNNYENRMLSYAGFCDKQGYGFVKYINQKYKIVLKSNINVKNGSLQQAYPPATGYFYDIKYPITDNNLVLINADLNDIKIFFKNDYKVIEKSNNCYFAIKND